MIERLFEASIPAKTLEKRAQRIEEKIKTNVFIPLTVKNHSEIPQKPENQEVMSPLAGPGRSPKFNKPTIPASKPPPQPYTNAVYIADIAISQLERITADDPKREKAFKIDATACPGPGLTCRPPRPAITSPLPPLARVQPPEPRALP